MKFLVFVIYQPPPPSLFFTIHSLPLFNTFDWYTYSHVDRYIVSIYCQAFLFLSHFKNSKRQQRKGNMTDEIQMIRDFIFVVFFFPSWLSFTFRQHNEFNLSGVGSVMHSREIWWVLPIIIVIIISNANIIPLRLTKGVSQPAATEHGNFNIWHQKQLRISIKSTVKLWRKRWNKLY